MLTFSALLMIEVIVGTLKREDRMFRQWLASAVAARSNRSEDRILGLFHALHDRLPLIALWMRVYSGKH